jgi:hypothetical protein
VVESEGSEKARSFFSTTVNWEEMARDVISSIFDEDAPMAQLFAVATRGLMDNFYVGPYTLDEMTFTVRRPLRLPF